MVKDEYKTERIPTGIEGLDKLIQGGLPKGSITLFVGTPGTGKSILGTQIIYNNAKAGRKCLYLNLEQDGNRLQRQMVQFGWDPDAISKKLKIVTVNTNDPKVVEYILDEIKKLDYDLIVMDSLDSISSVPPSANEFYKNSLQQVAEYTIPTPIDMNTLGRLRLKEIFSAVAKSGATAILTSERVEGGKGISRDTISEFLCDGIILMKTIETSGKRMFTIRKMRLTSHDILPRFFTITDKGITI